MARRNIKNEIRRYLLENESGITNAEAYMLLGTTKLGTRVGEMIREGEPIDKETVQVMNRYGQYTNVTRYYITEKGREYYRKKDMNNA